VNRQSKAKLECLLQALREGCRGSHAAAYVRRSGFALTAPGVEQRLRQLGGEAAVYARIAAGWSNAEIVEEAFPGENLEWMKGLPPKQGELFEALPSAANTAALWPAAKAAPFESTRITLRVPSDLYEAICIAARVEQTSRTQLIVDLLTSALSRIPELPREE